MSDERCVLVVEDDVGLASMLQELLESEGYPVVVVHDGQRALHEGLSRRFDVLFCWTAGFRRSTDWMSWGGCGPRVSPHRP
ncbi:hypothetical protein [Arthrobacter sp. A5]|uniref:hypothetical protein n=1 Tax=Arthrobacter sp. A5 TaxID=576926 RepID=UPI003DA87ECF